MNQYISVILSTAFIFIATVSHANTDKVPACQGSLMKVTTEILHTEGVTKINSCAGTGTSDNCQLDFYGCYEDHIQRTFKCSLRYTYGGAYYNYDDYTFVVDSACQIQSLSIERL